MPLTVEKRTISATEWLQGQWSDPKDIFTILMITGGQVVQHALAQLCTGPVPRFTPVAFSFGWVTRSTQQSTVPWLTRIGLLCIPGSNVPNTNAKAGPGLSDHKR
jgi:hypothetical protein